MKPCRAVAVPRSLSQQTFARQPRPHHCIGRSFVRSFREPKCRLEPAEAETTAEYSTRLPIENGSGLAPMRRNADRCIEWPPFRRVLSPGAASSRSGQRSVAGDVRGRQLSRGAAAPEKDSASRPDLQTPSRALRPAYSADTKNKAEQQLLPRRFLLLSIFAGPDSLAQRQHSRRATASFSEVTQALLRPE